MPVVQGDTNGRASALYPLFGCSSSRPLERALPQRRRSVGPALFDITQWRLSDSVP